MKLVLAALAMAMTLAVQGDSLVLHPLMKDVVAAQATVLWDVGNRAMDDDGNPSAKNLTAADWPKLAAAAKAMKDASAKMAAASQIIVAGPNDKLQDDDASGSAKARVQKYLDGDRKAFSEHARVLEAVSAQFLDAATSKDVKKLFEASGHLDEVCEGCHMKFWYPDQGK